MSDTLGNILRIKIKLCVWSVVLLSFTMCSEDPVSLNHPPSLKLEGYKRVKASSGKDSLLVFQLFIEDKDGDIGLTDSDTNSTFAYGSPWFYNLWVIQRDWSNGSPEILRIPGRTDTIENGFRLPDMRSDSRNKYINANIEVSVQAEPYPGLKPSLVVYEFQLFDRELNTSKRVATEKIQLEH